MEFYDNGNYEPKGEKYMQKLVAQPSNNQVLSSFNVFVYGITNYIEHFYKKTNYGLTISFLYSCHNLVVHDSLKPDNSSCDILDSNNFSCCVLSL